MFEPELISGGFYVTRSIARPHFVGEALLPERLITLSSCLTEFLPDIWALEWTSCSRDERIAAVQKLGLPEELLPTLMRLAAGALERGELGWPCVWQSASAARTALAQLNGPPTEFQVLELGVPQDAVAMLLAELAPEPGQAECGVLTRLKSAEAIDSRAVPLGWEVLGAECDGTFHSWLCNSLHNEASIKLGIKPGPFGLLTAEHDARAVVMLIDDGLGAEPVPWFRGRIHRVE